MRHASTHRLDGLMNNAGVMALPHRQHRRRLRDAVRHQPPRPLRAHRPAARPLLLAGARRPRVVTTSSHDAPDRADALGRPPDERRYQKWLVYGQTKLANLLFAFELDRRATRPAELASRRAPRVRGDRPAGHQRRGDRGLGRARVMGVLMATGNVLAGQSAEGGALPQLFVATAEGVASGDYYGPDGPFEMRGSPKAVGMSGAARDDEAPGTLWELSERRPASPTPGRPGPETPRDRALATALAGRPGAGPVWGAGGRRVLVELALMSSQVSSCTGPAWSTALSVSLSFAAHWKNRMVMTSRQEAAADQLHDHARHLLVVGDREPEHAVGNVVSRVDRPARERQPSGGHGRDDRRGRTGRSICAGYEMRSSGSGPTTGIHRRNDAWRRGTRCGPRSGRPLFSTTRVHHRDGPAVNSRNPR